MMSTSILCVDDHDSCSNLYDILSDLGCQVDVACNTSDALNSLMLKDYPVGVFAFGTPEVDGVELWKQMNKGRGKHGCVMLTDDILSANVLDAVARLGDHCHLIKPINIVKLIAFIDDSTGEPRRSIPCLTSA